jgi:hypothetical protein
METSLSHSLLRLAAEEMLSVESPVGRCVMVFQGKVWITQEGDLGDYLVSAGESFTFDRRGLALIEALEPTSLVMLVEPNQGSESVGYEAAWPQAELAQAKPVREARYGLTRATALHEAA